MKILIVEDDHLQADSLRIILQQAFPGVKVERIETEFRFRNNLKEIAKRPPDLILMDVMLRWDDPSPALQPPPDEIMKQGFYRAGFRCEKLLADFEATNGIPLILYSVFERTELERELQGLRSNVIYRRKESDPSDLIRAIRSFVYIDDPTPGIFHNVFIVHGHDQEAAEVVARFIEKLNFIPIILQEQASLGRTIIEKFEECSNVAFAIVLVTPDDIVVSKDATEGQESRARQNVIFELGFFVAKLGRGRVCILFKKSVEIPSDYKGVVYISMDSKGNWRTELAREMKAVGLPVDLNRII